MGSTTLHPAYLTVLAWQQERSVPYHTTTPCWRKSCSSVRYADAVQLFADHECHCTMLSGPAWLVKEQVEVLSSVT